MSVHEAIDLGIACYSVLVAGATFLLGFYLSEKIRGTPSDRLSLFRLAILSLTIPSILVIPLLILLSFNTVNSYWVFLVSFLVILLFPPAVLIGVLIKSWD